MATKDKNFKVTFGLPEGSEWSRDKVEKMHNFIKTKSVERSSKQKQKNELMGILYKMEEYVNDKASRKNLTIDDFLKAYLDILNLTFKKFAVSIDTTDGNLRKYLSGERKFNIDLAMKFGHFFHTPPEIWLQIQIRNEFQELYKEKRRASQYRKYDFEKVV